MLIPSSYPFEGTVSWLLLRPLTLPTPRPGSFKAVTHMHLATGEFTLSFSFFGLSSLLARR